MYIFSKFRIMYIEIQYYDLLRYFRPIQFYLLNVTCIVLYIFGSVATHGHDASCVLEFDFWSTSSSLGALRITPYVQKNKDLSTSAHHV
jgi:hypothetical protein